MYRSDVVGSMLRPVYLKEARAQHKAGALSEAAFKQIADRAVREAIELQQRTGIAVLTAVAFDEEGFYRMSDAGRFADPDDPTEGIEFAGRISEEFKLTSGTWADTSAPRIKALEALTPLA